MKRISTFTFSLCLLAATLAPVRADEGMWLFTNPPLQQLKTKYGFEPTPAWLEHVQKSSVRFNSGGSGSFVSADGLVMTNHHVGADCLAKISTKTTDYLKHGFLAASRNDERKCVDVELNVLMSVENITERVNAAVKAGASPVEAQRARRAVTNGIEKESLEKTGLRSDVVTLYNGGQYHLYRYKKYTDVRLVFAPEKATAFFGGDPDNFEFPRYDLDITFFRAYENGKPTKVEHYLKWSKDGVKDGELIFVSGHPGRTERLNTIRHMEYLRDVVYPRTLNLLRRREVMLDNFSSRSAENARRAEELLFGIQNSRKARLGMLGGLQDPALVAKKGAAEQALREAVMKSPELKAECGTAWDDIAAAVERSKSMYDDFSLWERGSAFNSQLFTIARRLVRMAEESRKPNAERLREYSEAARESLLQDLYSEAPVYPDLETVKLADSLSMMLEIAGSNNEIAQKAIAGKSPQDRAAELIRGSKLADVAVRKKLVEGGLAAIEASDDPMIQLARLIDPSARILRTAFENTVDEPMRQAYGKIARARFAIFGTNLYPDATFTLRLSYGQAKGYEENGQQIPWATTMGGTFAHAADHQNKEPFELPKSWLVNKSKINPNTPFNFVGTADIIGGNSGSPVVNKAGELVGIIFDGNIQSLVLDSIYTEERARAVSVHSSSILEALNKVYRAGALASEITGTRK